MKCNICNSEIDIVSMSIFGYGICPTCGEIIDISEIKEEDEKNDESIKENN